MAVDSPNILLLMTDQHRGDCLGIDGHPVLQTPYLDAVGGTGIHFRRAYSACPVCLPARRTLITGQQPCHHGVLANAIAPLTAATLPEVLSEAGYQTHLVGKLHLFPERKLYGFHSAQWADCPIPGLRMSTRHHDALANHFSSENDYERFLSRSNMTPPGVPAVSSAHGLDDNGHIARPWHLPEPLHFSNWCADQAIEFLERRDPTRPFFLKVSFFHPHTPCTPPPWYFDLYMAMDLPRPHVGDWVDQSTIPSRGMAVDAPRVNLEPHVLKQFMSGYFGSITHVDHQIGRIMQIIPKNTIIVFCSDHGEMMGDHHWMRKSLPYEGSARIPLLMKFPEGTGLPQGRVVDEPVELMDIMPTLLDAAGTSIPETVDGHSVLPLLRGESQWRPYLHGELSNVPLLSSDDPYRRTGMQYLTDGKRKYIWFPGLGIEQFFDLERDPHEINDRSEDSELTDEVSAWRSRLIKELADRPEGFTNGQSLNVLHQATTRCLIDNEDSD